MEIKLKKLNPEASLPTKAHDIDACFDLVALTERLDVENRYLEYGTGLSISIPSGFCGKIYPRSSIRNKDLVLSNSCGIIDAGYLGEIKVIFKGLIPVGARRYKVGDKIAQIKIEKVEEIKFVEVNDLGNSERGSGGFGSSGS